MAKRKIPVFHNNHTIQKALSDIEGGLTLAATARKYGLHYSTAYSWTQKNNTTIQPIGKITVELEEESFLRLQEICKNEVRTLEQQVKYLVLEGMTRRNPIPF